jgi:RNA polymerase sigma factor (sigma-70 family)
VNGDPPTDLGELEDATDGELAVVFAAGDQAAYAALYERFARPIYDFVRRTVRDHAAAEDLTQNVFLQAYERRGSLRDPDAVRAWLFRIAHNAAINHLTRSHVSEELDEAAASPTTELGPEDVVQQRETVELVWDAAASLEPRQYAVLDLTVRKGLTTAEVAEVLDVDAAQASLVVFRAREALGNAVRFLLVARSRRHCNRLAELVPEGVRQLSPAERATVDRHMRRCEACRGMALVLTSTEQLLAATPLLSLPPALRAAPHLVPTSAGSSLPLGHAAPVAHRLARALAVGASAVVVVGIAGPYLFTHLPGTATPADVATIVTTYQPWALNAQSGEAAPRPGLHVTAATGTCEGGTPADPGRASAFRCLQGNQLRDACFDPSPLALPGPAVLCSGDPTTSRVTMVSLTSPLPDDRRNPEDAHAEPWFLVLRDGKHCARLSGGTDIAVLRYQCAEGTFVAKLDRSRQPWTVHEGHFDNSTPLISRKAIAISRAYR